MRRLKWLLLLAIWLAGCVSTTPTKKFDVRYGCSGTQAGCHLIVTVEMGDTPTLGVVPGLDSKDQTVWAIPQPTKVDGTTTWNFDTGLKVTVSGMTVTVEGEKYAVSKFNIAQDAP